MTDAPCPAADHPAGDPPDRLAAVEVVLLDVNETLSDLRPLGDAFSQAGLPALAAPTWFARVLRDGFALAVTGERAGFRDIGADALSGLATELGVALTPAARDGVLDTVGTVALHPDVAPGITALVGAGRRVATLSNGAPSVADALLRTAGVRQHVTATLTADDAGAWKPAAAAYTTACAALGVAPGHALLAAVHPWDVHGAQRAGLATAWVARQPGRYPDFFAAPDLTVPGLTALADRLGAHAG